MRIVDDLERLAGLYRDGALSEREFATAKQHLFATSEVPTAHSNATLLQPDGCPTNHPQPATMYRPTGFGSRPAQLAAADRRNNTPALTGFILGLVSVALYFVMIFPILALAFSWRGLATFDESRQKNKWMAVAGLILGVVYCLLSLNEHGHLR